MGRGARIKFVFLIAIAAASLLLGCSDSGDSEPLTKEAYVKQAKAICDKGVKEKDRTLQTSFRGLSAKPSQEELENLVLEVLSPLEKTVEELGELTPPSKDEDVVDNFTQEYEQSLQKAKSNPAKVVRSDPFAAPNKSAQKYGLTSCSL